MMSDGEIKSSSSSETNSDSESSSSSSNESDSASENESIGKQQTTTNQIPPVTLDAPHVQESTMEKRSNILQSDTTESAVEIVTENVENPKETIANVAVPKPQDIEFVNNEDPKIVDAHTKRHVHSENSGPKAKKMKSCVKEKSLSPPPKQVQKKDRRSSESPERKNQDDNKGRKEKPAGITGRRSSSSPKRNNQDDNKGRKEKPAGIAGRHSSSSPKRNNQDDNKGRKEKPAGITGRRKSRSPKRNNQDDNKGRKEKPAGITGRRSSRSPKRNNQDDNKGRKEKPAVITGRRSSRSPKRNNEDDNKGRKEKPAGITERQRRTVDLLTSRTGGAYIPPAKLRMLQAEITDKSSMAYQRIAWEALKKSIHGYINKVNVDNIGIITRELLKENIVRGSGLLCRSIIQAQAASPTFTHVYAALVAIINSKFPKIGELLLQRLVIQFKRGFRRNDKGVCISSSRFIAHLVNQRVAHEILALQILTLLVESPTDDSVEVAIAFLKECGMKLTEVSSKGVNAIFEMLKNILHEGKLDKRVQYMIEVVFQVRKDGFKDHQSVIEALELVEEEDQFTHLINLDETTNPQDVLSIFQFFYNKQTDYQFKFTFLLDVFKFDEKYETNEDKYKGLSKELLGSDISDSDGGSSGSDSDESGDEGDGDKEKGDVIIDNTETNLVALRRTIYLTIHSSLDYEECAHKLMKMQLKPGQEMELCHMFLDCCAEQRTYEKFYGLLAQRFCMINKVYVPPFEDIFRDTYHTTHRLDTNRLRNVSKFFAHLLFTDAIGWDVFECMKLNEEDTTSSSRIFIKILFQELAEYMGLGKLNDRLKDQTLSESFAGLFPRDNPRNTRFAINFFTSIGLGGLTDELREFLKTAPRVIPAVNQDVTLLSNSSSSTSSESSSDSSSSTSSESSSSSSTDSSGSDKKKIMKKSVSKRRKKKSASSSGSDEEDSRKASKKKKLTKKQTSRNVENQKSSTVKHKKNVTRQEARDSMKQSEKRKRNKSPETENHSMKQTERRASPRSNSFQRERVRDSDEKNNVSGKIADNRQKDDRDRYEYKNRNVDQIKQNDRRREDDDRETKRKPVSDRRQEDFGKQLSSRRRDDRYRDNDRKYESERRQEVSRHRDEYKRNSDQMRVEKRTRHDSGS